MTTTITAPDQSARAQDVIELMLILDPEVQQRTLARLIAATLHNGPSTALYRFASMDLLDNHGLLEELDDVRVPLEREGWVDALARYALFTGDRA